MGRRVRGQRGSGTTTMDIAPLAGKIAALSFGALPVSFLLSLVAEISQCVGQGGPAGRGRADPLFLFPPKKRVLVGSSWDG